MKKFGMTVMVLGAFLCLQQESYSQGARSRAPMGSLHGVGSSSVRLPSSVRKPQIRNVSANFANRVNRANSAPIPPSIQPVVPQPTLPVAQSKSGSCCGTNACGTQCDPCCPAFWEHRNSFYTDFLYLTARGANVNFATPVDGIGATARPTGHIAVGDPDYDSGIRFGGTWALDPCSSIEFVFTYWDSNTQHSVTRPGGGNFVRADLTFPNTANIANDSLAARANYDLGFRLFDLQYKSLISGGDNHFLNYIVGVRYAHLDQDFVATYTINGATTVDSEIDFNGFGPRFGLDGERLLCGGLFLYGRGFLSILMGEFDVEYMQSNVFAGQQAFTGFNDDRVVPVIEFELGGGWQSECGTYRVSAGYHFASWFNAITTQSTIASLKTNSFADIDQTITFDGLAARAEIRY